MNFYIVSIPFGEYVPDPMQRAFVYVAMDKWCQENVELRHKPESLHYWFPRAFRGRSLVYKFHFRDETDYNNFIKQFKLEAYVV